MQIYYYEQRTEVLKRLKSRAAINDANVLKIVRSIIDDVAQRGNKALFYYTKKFDGFDIDEGNMTVTQKEIDLAYDTVKPETIEVLKKSAQNIKTFHEKQLRKSWFIEKDGAKVGQIIRPIDKVGLYVPGGKASYPSSVLMNVIPAKVAGASNISIATPADKNGNISPAILVAADIAGADVIYKIGGAQAIAALAYGTQSIEKVDKITGPGNAYVAAAKREVFGQVGIDMIAGPSEILIIADSSAKPEWLSADLLSQAEHDEAAACILITTDEEIAEKTDREVTRQLGLIKRANIAKNSIKNFGAIIIVENLDEAVSIANDIAPEHIELIVKNPYDIVDKVKAAGAIFIGQYAPEPLGDYFAGTNHVLPTNSTARFSSALSVDDFILKSSLIDYSKEAYKKVYSDVGRFANLEGLTAHERSARVRFDKLEEEK
ncbi:MAG: histidinol dehydrogenase [Eubacteriales bacterium]